MVILPKEAMEEIGRLSNALMEARAEVAELRQQQELTAQALLILGEAVQSAALSNQQLIEGQQGQVSLLLGILRMMQREWGHESIVFGMQMPTELS